MLNSTSQSSTSSSSTTQPIDSKAEIKPLPSLEAIRISASLAPDLKAYNYDKVRQSALQLWVWAKALFHESANPFYIVQNIIDAIAERHFFAVEPSSQIYLMQALHTYVDLAVLRLFADPTYKVFLDEKREGLKILNTILSKIEAHEDLAKNVALRYALTSARAGVKALEDTSNWKTESKEIVKIIGLIVGKQIAATVSTIWQLIKNRQEQWYVDVLTLRWLTPFASQSLKYLKHLHQFMAEEGILNSSDWQVRYAMQEALAEITLNGAHYLIKYSAFTGGDAFDEKKSNACVITQAERPLVYSRDLSILNITIEALRH